MFFMYKVVGIVLVNIYNLYIFFVYLFFKNNDLTFIHLTLSSIGINISYNIKYDNVAQIFMDGVVFRHFSGFLYCVVASMLSFGCGKSVLSTVKWNNLF